VLTPAEVATRLSVSRSLVYALTGASLSAGHIGGTSGTISHTIANSLSHTRHLPGNGALCALEVPPDDIAFDLAAGGET
jgi:hypothetical protein